MIQELENYMKQFTGATDQKKSSLALALGSLLTLWRLQYGDTPLPHARETLEQVYQTLGSREPVIKEVEPLLAKRYQKQPDNFLLRVSRSGYDICVDAEGNYAATIVNLGTIEYTVLKSLGFDIHFYEDSPLHGKPNPDRTMVATGDLLTKHKIHELERLQSSHPLLSSLHNMVDKLPYETIRSQFEEGIIQLLNQYPKFKP